MTRKTPNTAPVDSTQGIVLIDEKSLNFWDMRVSNYSVDVRYGKLGEIGQVRSKPFADAEAASKYADKLLNAKFDDGYCFNRWTKWPEAKTPKITHKASTPITDNRIAISRDTNSSVIPRVRRSPRIREQIEVVNGLKTEIIRRIKRKLRGIESNEVKTANWNRLLREVELSAESFKLKFKECSAKEVERTKSMLHGPFFTSAEFPIPVAASGMMVPVVQIDLTNVAAAIGEYVSDGLLQLWQDIVSIDEHVIRVIPHGKVDIKKLTKFKLVLPSDFDGFPLPFYFENDPCGDEIQQIIGLTSTGITCQASSIEVSLQDIRKDASKELIALLERLLKLAPDKSTDENVTLFGTFLPIQYGAADVDMNCLINIDDWGSTGNAQIFYKIDKKEATQFSFWSCVR